MYTADMNNMIATNLFNSDMRDKNIDYRCESFIEANLEDNLMNHEYALMSEDMRYGEFFIKNAYRNGVEQSYGNGVEMQDNIEVQNSIEVKKDECLLQKTIGYKKNNHKKTFKRAHFSFCFVILLSSSLLTGCGNVTNASMGDNINNGAVIGAVGGGLASYFISNLLFGNTLINIGSAALGATAGGIVAQQWSAKQENAGVTDMIGSAATGVKNGISSLSAKIT